MKRLKSVVEDTDTRAGKVFDVFIQALILASLLSFSLGTIPALSQRSLDLLKGFQLFCVIVFTIEYVLRILVADKKLGYIFSFYGIIDLVAILPFFLSLGVDLRSLRIVRIFRLFRVIKMMRYSRALRRFQLALKIAREELLVFFIATCILFFVAGAGIYRFENPVQPEVFTSVFSSMYWAVITLTTVGYGDIYPITVGGRIFTFVILMIGLGVVAVPTGILSSSLSKARAIEKGENEHKETVE